MNPPTLDELRADYLKQQEKAKLIRRCPGPRFKDDKPELSPLNKLERSIYAKVQTASFPIGTASKRFMQGNAEKIKLSDKGRAFLAYVAHRFRRQYKLTEDEWKWVDHWKMQKDADYEVNHGPNP